MSEQAYGWNEELPNESGPMTLPPGEAEFEVVKLEKKHNNKRNCPQAVYTIRAKNQHGTTLVTEHILLHSCAAWKAAEFFISLRLMAPDAERVPAAWDKAVGQRGRCDLITDDWTNDKGQTFTNNKIGKFLPPNSKASPEAGGVSVTAPAATADNLEF